jgi:hypothetical protein
MTIILLYICAILLWAIASVAFDLLGIAAKTGMVMFSSRGLLYGIAHRIPASAVKLAVAHGLIVLVKYLGE